MSFIRPLNTHLVCLLLIVAANVVGVEAQVVTGEGPRHPGATGEAAPVDTSALREGRIRTEESTGLFEGPIDPDRYRVGPADQMTVSIVGTRSMQYDLEVSPDGRLLVPTVGVVDVRGKTLSQAERAVMAAASRYYSAANVSLALRRMRKFKVHVVGAVVSPGTVVATPTTRVSEAIALAGGPSSQAENRRITVRHRDGTATSVDLLPFLSVGERAANPELNDGDVVQVPFQDANAIVQVFGSVQRPGEYTYRAGDSISSMLRYVMGVTADASRDSIEVITIAGDGHLARSYHRLLDNGAVSDDRELRAGDRIFVRGIPDYLRVDRIVVKGEVRYPGSYAIEPGRTRLREIIERAGGFDNDASMEDAALYRRRLAADVDARFAAIQMIDPEKRTQEQMSYWERKFAELSRPGEMTVNFNALMRGDESQNVVVMDKDSLFVPETKGVIRVTGRVRNPGAVTYKAGLTYNDYVGLAGGYGWRADEDATEIVKEGSGEVFLASSDDTYELEPGDAIWVPEEQPGSFMEAFTTGLTILAQVATIIAVVVSVRANSSGN